MPGEEARNPAKSGWGGVGLLLALIAFGSGFGVMLVELAAVRQLAPSFGDSVPVWTNVIGVILLALALGALWGGYLADRGRFMALPLFLGLGGAFVPAIPFLVPRLAGWILPEALPLDRVLPVLAMGSLGVSLLVFAPPVLLLGSLSPLLIRFGCRTRPEGVGRVSGLVYASGTFGSLAGTFATTWILVPGLGLRLSFLAAGLLLLCSALLGLLLVGRRPGAGHLCLLLPLGTVLFPPPPPVWLKEGEELCEARDSFYQRLWMVEGREEVGGEARRMRSLKINEGLDSFHSVRIEGTPFTNGRYYDSFALLAPLLPASGVRVLSLGAAGGSILRILGSLLGDRMEAVAVELDPDAFELGKRWLGSGEIRGTVRWLSHLGARVYVQYVDRDDPPFDLVCLDTYRNQFYLPAHLASVEFFRALRERMEGQAILALNLGDLGQDGRVLEAVARTLALVFPRVESFRVGGMRNFLLLAHDREPGLLHRGLFSKERPPGLSPGIWEPALRQGASRLWPPFGAGEGLSDDRSLLPRLHEALYGRSWPLFQEEE